MTITQALKIKDAYGLHKTVYGLFEDVRNDAEKQSSIPSGIVYADKGGFQNTRQILMLSNRRPHQTPQFGTVVTKEIHSSFLQFERYAFEITINPSKRDKQTGKLIPIRGREVVEQWFNERAPISWGFSVNPKSLQVEKIGVQDVEKAGKNITHCSAVIKGQLTVIDRNQFIQSFTKGIGRGRAFGFGLLQIVPLV